MADYAPKFPKHIARKVKHPRFWSRLAKDLAGADRRTNSFLATTQAIDLIKGGVKVNALPEVVEGEYSLELSFSLR
jgi:Gly-Xaa carboxypeptidase